jgi:hypothetical protein
LRRLALLTTTMAYRPWRISRDLSIEEEDEAAIPGTAGTGAGLVHDEVAEF